LQVQHFFDPAFSEQMMTATNALLKTKASQQVAKILELDVGVGSPRNIVSKSC